MELTESIIVQKPLEQVWVFFDNPDNLPKWQKTLQSYRRLSGSPGQPGARAELTYNENGRIIKLTETIDARSERQQLAGTYHVENVTQKMTVTFKSVDMDLATEVTFHTEVSLTGPLRFLAGLMKTGFQNRIRSQMKAFKESMELEN